jgi:hypothetical protein
MWGVAASVLLSLGIGCGSTTSKPTEPGDGGMTDASNGGDGATGDASCPAVPIHCRCPSGCLCPDPVCTNGTWVCPSPSCTDAAVTCGTGTLQCLDVDQFCEGSSVGPQPPPDASYSNVSYSCVVFPPACAMDHSCSCLETNSPCSNGCALLSCNADGAGGIRVQCTCP